MNHPAHKGWFLPRLVTIASICWLCVFPEPALTDILVLKNGRTLEIGSEYWRSRGKIHVRRPEGVFSIPWEMVEHLERTSSSTEKQGVRNRVIKGRFSSSEPETAPENYWMEDLRDIGASLEEILNDLKEEPKPLPPPTMEQSRDKMESLLERLEGIRRQASSPESGLSEEMERALEDLKACMERTISLLSSEEEISFDLMEECAEIARRGISFSQ